MFYSLREATDILFVRPELLSADSKSAAEFEIVTGKRTYIAADGGMRSHARQAELDAESKGEYPVASVGSSHHEYGAARDRLILSADSPTEADYRKLAEISAKYGLVNRFGKADYDPTDKGHRQLNETLAVAKQKWDELKKKGLSLLSQSQH